MASASEPSLPVDAGGAVVFEAAVGRGAAGAVFRVRRGGELLAAKLFDDAELCAREERMLRLAAPVWAPSWRGRGEARDAAGHTRAYLLLDWAEGASLDASPALPTAAEREQRIWCILHGVGRALTELHDAGIRHGDVKPANILCTATTATLVDLSLAQQAGELTGYTREYAAPELLEYPSSLAADVFALGRVALGVLGAFDATPALGALLAAMTAPAPGARPRAEHVVERARAALAISIVPSELAVARERRVRAAYLAIRSTEVTAAFSLPAEDLGPAAPWLAPLADPTAAPLPALTAWQKLRLVERITGKITTTLPAAYRNEAALLRALLALVAEPSPAAGPADWIAAALALDESLEAIENAGAEAPWPLRRAAARRWLVRGELARASLLVDGWSAGADKRLVQAEVLRRTGRATEAVTLLTDDGGEATPCRARALWDLGQIDAAEQLVAGYGSPRSHEVHALCMVSRGQHGRAIECCEEALPWSNHLERARLLGVRALCRHALGDSERALEDFTEARRLASQEGALLEEASFATGAAAAASDAGRLAAALDAATAASLLWERAARPAQAARALLVRSTVLSLLGASFEALEAATSAELAASAGADSIARDYAAVAALEARGLGATMLRADAEQLQQRAASHTAEVRVRIEARLLAWDLLTPERCSDWDLQVGELSVAARWDWFSHRLAYPHPNAREGEPHLEALVEATMQLPEEAVAADVRLLAYDGLIRAVGSERAPPWHAKRRALVASLRRHVPREYIAAFDQKWQRADLETPSGRGFEPEQWLQIERLTRLLHGGSSVGVVGARVLDALLLWTGAERGLLLVKGEGGVLEPKSARNLGREDLSTEQLSLSRSLADRALATGDVVRTHLDDTEATPVARSIHALRLRSILVIPLLVRGEPQGVLYLDDRTRAFAFRDVDLAWVRALAAQAAHALDAAHERRRLEKAVRRAERAEAELSRRVDAQTTEIEVLRESLAKEGEQSALRGHSAAMDRLRHTVARVASAQLPVLVRGESGTGKELVARALHDESSRRDRAFVSENCAALPETLLESTLFGHVRGAFTGASSARVGLFEMAHRGTLFLDEIGEMSLAMQAKLLRVLETGEFYPVGSEKQKRVDVRVVAATHRDLEALVKQGTFRQDLLFRLAVVELRVPPLRERTEDIPLLVAHFFAKHDAPKGLKVSPAALSCLMAFAWPGNVRQLENELRKQIVFATDVVEVTDLAPAIQDTTSAVAEQASEPRAEEAEGVGLRGKLDALETELVENALRLTGWNRSRAAEKLGISRFGLQKMIRRLGLRPPN